MHTRTGPHHLGICSAYHSSRSSRPSLSKDRLMTWKCTSIGLIFSTSSSQRDVIHAHGHTGSNHRSTVFVLTPDPPLATCLQRQLEHGVRRSLFLPSTRRGTASCQ